MVTLVQYSEIICFITHRINIYPYICCMHSFTMNILRLWPRKWKEISNMEKPLYEICIWLSFYKFYLKGSSSIFDKCIKIKFFFFPSYLLAHITCNCYNKFFAELWLSCLANIRDNIFFFLKMKYRHNYFTNSIKTYM